MKYKLVDEIIENNNYSQYSFKDDEKIYIYITHKNKTRFIIFHHNMNPTITYNVNAFIPFDKKNIKKSIERFMKLVVLK
jgi:hypothetical protein